LVVSDAHEGLEHAAVFGDNHGGRCNDDDPGRW
jgi:hypothetical protein